jgi:PTS system cellobiose-specific IIB component
VTKVYVVCGAGASSTFLAVRLRARSKHLGYDFEFLPSAIESVNPSRTDIIAVASHISNEKKIGLFEECGARVINLPKGPIDDRLVEETIREIAKVLEDRKSDSSRIASVT